jgi:putative drug exporter of the RND superfamily
MPSPQSPTPSAQQPGRRIPPPVWRIVNGFMRALLGLPLPTPLGKRLMLVEFTGRKTGRHYRQPVSYVRHDHALLTPGGGNWKRNLKPGQPIRLHINGRDQTAIPEIVTDPDAVADLLAVMIATNPAVTRFSGIGLDTNGRPDRQRVGQALEHGFAIVRWRLNQPRPETPSAGVGRAEQTSSTAHEGDPSGGEGKRAVLISWVARTVSGRTARWLLVVVWIVLAGVAGSVGSKLTSVENNDAQTWLPGGAQSLRALNVANEHFGSADISDAVIVYTRAGGLTAADKTAVRADVTSLRRFAYHGPVSGPVFTGDGQAALISVPLLSPSGGDQLTTEVKNLRQAVQAGTPAGLASYVSGPAGVNADLAGSFSGLDRKLLLATLLVVAVVLLITYRSPVLWLLPLISVGIAVEVGSAVVYLLAKSNVLLVNGEATSILYVLLFGVGTDYALLIISRYREELRRYESRQDAMATAVRQALPPVLASAATVTIALLCLLAAQMNSTHGMGPVLAIGVVVTFLVMATLLPALLVVFGRWVFWPFIPRYRPDAAGAVVEHRTWRAVAGLVGRRPRVIWPVTVLVLGALAAGIAGLHTGLTDQEQFMTTPASVTGEQVIAAHFPAGLPAPVNVYAKQAAAPAVLAAVASTPGVASAQQAAASGGWVQVNAVLTAQPDSPAAEQTVTRLRQSTGGIPGADALVGGTTATTLDTNNAEGHDEQVIIPLILAVVFTILVILLQALIAPLLLLACAALSYAAALGAAALLFHAIGHPHVNPSVPLFGFLFLVALGVDYTIFYITRAKEETARAGHRAGGIAALVVTGGVITSAGLVLTATFSVLTVLPAVFTVQLGLLVAAGVLLDTFVVRALLVSSLTLDMGPHIWWPGRLSRLHRQAALPAEFTGGTRQHSPLLPHEKRP